jgi:hypothetical protein
MSRVDRKTKIREYKDAPPPAGVYQIRNTATGRLLVGSAVNLPGRLNRHRFALQVGSHPSADLQADWNERGADAFEFTELDRLAPSDEPGYDPSGDLVTLMQMWLERLESTGASFYEGSERGA